MNSQTEKPQTHSNPLWVMIGCLCLVFAIASYGLSLSTIQGPILSSLNGTQYFSVLTVISSIAICVMTPVGGRLMDMMPIKLLLLIAGGLSIISGLAMALIPNLWVFMIARVILSLSQGLYASMPFIIVRFIYPPKQVPKAIGFITMAMAIGSLLGSFLAGWLAQHGFMKMAIAFPIVALAVGMFFICTKFENKPSMAFKLDYLGIILLAITLTGLLLGLNNGPVDGWFSRSVVFSFSAGLIGLIAFIAWENKAEAPIIPMRMLANREYSLLLMIGFLLMFYMTAMNVYMPLAVQDILQAGTAASGMLQTPKTIVTMIAPVICGAWVVKHTRNLWIGLALSGVFVALPFTALIWTGVHMPLWFIMTMLAFTGLADSLRSVSLMPAAQSILAPKDMGVGTSLIGFVSTLSGSIAAAFFGLAYNSLSQRTPGIKGQIDGIDTICLIVAVAAAAAVLMTVLLYRPMLMSHAAEEQAKKEPAKK